MSKRASRKRDAKTLDLFADAARGGKGGGDGAKTPPPAQGEDDSIDLGAFA